MYLVNRKLNHYKFQNSSIWWYTLDHLPALLLWRITPLGIKVEFHLLMEDAALLTRQLWQLSRNQSDCHQVIEFLPLTLHFHFLFFIKVADVWYCLLLLTKVKEEQKILSAFLELPRQKYCWFLRQKLILWAKWKNCLH